jgi:hypothetical protein
MPSEMLATARLEQIGLRIDAIVDRLRRAPGGNTPRVARRVDALKAREATARTRRRAITALEDQTRHRAVVELEYELDEIDVELAIAEAQMDVNVAPDSQAFGATAEREIAAYGQYVEWMQGKAARAGADLRPASEALVRELRERRAVATEQLRRYRDAENARLETSRADVDRALAELDRVAQSRPIEHSTSGRAERLETGEGT